MEQHSPDKPPIPCPFDQAAALEAAPLPATPPQTLNYIVAAAIAIVTGVLIWFVSGVVGLWPVGLVVLSAYALSAVGATLQVRRAGTRIGWHVRRPDLPLVRSTVDLNMKGAYIMMTTVYPFFVVALARGQWWWSLPIVLFSVLFSSWSLGIEKRFKTMGTDADAAAEYLALIAAWKEARFGLKKESTA